MHDDNSAAFDLAAFIEALEEAKASNNLTSWKEVSDASGVSQSTLSRLKSGMQIFAGGMPIYRTVAGVPRLVGAIGVSGDGTDQDDMIAFLGVANAAAILGTGIGHAPAYLRADAMNFTGGRLRYVQCPVTPFNNSNEQDVCNGL